ncbi:hypothetical protein AKJ56_01645 [candidate division MSBL1 archaeon SCGC-AAA382N08]|uniref:Uncharacterized protein n=1 Tax=candidate division MSBL1 archaeon SCGC-AAA382N08 TaxID=1698285 RepID=A0A133VP56_9EURY|nr:hypothetical protein AKJ56_01645 [candidate division MSBL1 archaeon SCGC-AAA382N08]
MDSLILTFILFGCIIWAENEKIHKRLEDTVMKRLVLVLFLAVLTTGCYRSLYLPTVDMDTNIPIGGSGVVVTNNLPGSELFVKKVGFHKSKTYRAIAPGEVVFVKADFVIDHQEMVITVVGRADGQYVGSYSREYSFYPSRQRIYHWNVNYLRKGRY